MIGIPPDISYGLQCSVEGFDITEDVITFYYAFNDVDLAKMSDEYEHSQNHASIRDSLQEFARKVYYEPYREWFDARANQDQKVWCVARAGDSFGRKAAEMIDYKLSRYISDMLTDDLDPYSRDLQDTWLSRNVGFRHHEKITSELFDKIGILPMDQLLHAAHQPDDFSLRFPKPEPLVISSSDDDEQYTDNYIVRQTFSDPTAKRAEKKRRRKVLKKSAQFLKSLVGRETASLFIGGSKIEIEGKRFIFSVKVDSLYSQNYGALDISILEKSTKDYLCKLCWYVEETPALDQVSALVLAVQADCEDSIIKIGNSFSLKHETIARHTHVHDLIEPKSSDMFGFDFDIPDTDTMLQLTQGTTVFREKNPDLYHMFSRTCSDRLVRNIPSELMPKFTPLPPTSVRAFLADGTVSNELVFD